MPSAGDSWEPLATQLRADSIRATTAAGSGHPTSSMSAADLMAVLLSGHFHYDWKNPRDLDNDRFILSKGHAAPLLYSMYKAAGVISDSELLSLRKLGSRLEGHPTPVLPFVDVATGSLGQGLPAAIGMALAARLTRRDIRCWVLLGDSEMSEGSVYEALELGGHYALSQIIALIDMNRLGQRGPTMVQWDGDQYAARARAFGWKALLVDGHDHHAIDRAYAEAKSSLEELGNPPGDMIIETKGPRRTSRPRPAAKPAPFAPPRHAAGTKVATREAFGDALAALAQSREEVVALDGEVSNSTFSEKLQKVAPDRFFEMYIAEQQLVSAAVGMHVFGLHPFASTFAAFFSRAYDQIRMAAISRANLYLVGSHAGVSIGEDGPSQMGLEDLAMMRAVSGSTVLYPACATTAAELTREMAGRPGIHYLRTTREKTPVLYGPEERFPIGGSKILRQSSRDVAAVFAAGITLHEALRAHQLLEKDGLPVRIVDLYSVKPIDAATLEACARECGHLIVVEDHWPQGGLGDAVSEVFDDSPNRPTLTRLAVRGMPGSGTPQEQLDVAGISAKQIVEAGKADAPGGGKGDARGGFRRSRGVSLVGG